MIEDKRMEATEMGLESRELAVGYDRRILIDGISFPVRRGEILVLIGPNGAGKSTILKTLAGQLAPLGGSIYLTGSNMADMQEKQIARKLAILMTGRPGAELMTVEDMVATGRYPYTGRLGILSETDGIKIEEAMALVGLTDIREREFDRLSDGQRQRVMLARALCQEPEVLVLDEPTSFLDMHHKLELLGILKNMVRSRKLAVVMSLHELDLAQKCGDHLLCIKEGMVDRYGIPEDIFSADGAYIRELYHMSEGSFLPQYGSMELERPKGEPRVFVIGGGGSGIPVYRSLQRRGIPFAAGVLQENDLEYPVAQALAGKVVTVPAFEPVEGSAVEEAEEWIRSCEQVIEAVSLYGSGNQGNRRLAELAASLGKLSPEVR